MSGCFEQMRTLVNRKEPLILMDRCLWSTLAVHAAHSTERLAALLVMLEPIAKEIQVPDFTIILEASFATCQGRIAQKSGLALSLDQLTGNESFHQREHTFYRWLEKQVSGCLFLDVNHLTAEEAASRSEELIRNLARC
jgi:thymidylate kinase